MLESGPQFETVLSRFDGRLIGRVLICLLLAGSGSRLLAEQPQEIDIDGAFADWEDIESYSDPADDQHDTNGRWSGYRPQHVDHPDVDLLECKVAHDHDNLFFYFRARGAVGQTQKESPKHRPGRYYATVTIDVDRDEKTGYALHEGGYFPTSRGYDVNAEVEWFNGSFNSGQYLNHGCRNGRELRLAFHEQVEGKLVRDKPGPYPPGFVTLGPGYYDFYTQWSYHADDTITFTHDRGPVVPGIIAVAHSADGRQLEMVAPLKGFLVDPAGKPLISMGQSINLSFSLEASGELAPKPESGGDEHGRWASDTAEPIVGYVLESDN